MKTDKVVIAIAFSVVLLLFLISWTFYQSVQMDSERKIVVDEHPQKAVMEQTQRMNDARLDKIAGSGMVVRGMSTEQVRVALGDPVRVDDLTGEDEVASVWWYEREGWLSIVFGNNGKVIRIENEAEIGGRVSVVR